MLSFDWQLSGRCFDDESHDKGSQCPQCFAVLVESFHEASAGCRSLLVLLWPMAKA